MRGVSAIQQSQLRLNGGKQAVQRSPLQTAASHGHIVTSFFTESKSQFVSSKPSKIQAPEKLQSSKAHARSLSCHLERSETISDCEYQRIAEYQRSFASLRMTIAFVDVGNWNFFGCLSLEFEASDYCSRDSASFRSQSQRRSSFWSTCALIRLSSAASNFPVTGRHCPKR
jgi:hypothetical protein